MSWLCWARRWRQTEPPVRSSYASRDRGEARMREGDAAAAARRKLRIVEVDSTSPPVGPRGSHTRAWATGYSRLTGQPDTAQRPCTDNYVLLDVTVYGRRDMVGLAPSGWPRRWDVKGARVHTNRGPTTQWSRLRAGCSDDIGPSDAEPISGGAKHGGY
jgi:hypothetical protein